ncbi:MAG: hypothetical protein ACRCU0_01250 [Candidatus Rhabdochlamydia sp.]
MSIPDVINKKAFFLLKAFSELNNQFIIEDLQSPMESLIKPFVDKSSEKASQIFEEFLKDKEQQKIFLEKNISTAQQWRLIFAIYPNFCQHSLEDIFRAAIQASPNASVEDSQQIFTCLKENQGVDLNQIYVERYTAQFLTWIQSEVYALPSNSILLLLKIWQNFGNQSIKETWKELLSLSNWKTTHKQALDLFKSKHDFVIKNYLALQHIKFKEIASVAEVPKSIKNIPKLPINQYVLWTKALNYLLTEVVEAYGLGFLGFNKDSWEYQLLYTPREISPKILIWRAKKVTSSYQSKLQGLIEFFDGKIKDLKEAREKIQQLEYLLEQIKHGFPVYSDLNANGIETISEKQQKQYEKNQTISKEQIEGWLKNWKEIEESLQSGFKNPVRFRQDISHIEFLIKELVKSFVEPKKEIVTEEQIACAEKHQRELIQAEDEFISSQKKSLKSPSTELVDTDAIEILSSSDDELKENVAFHTPALPKLCFVEIDAFLKNKGQLNGALSKSINGFFKQLKKQLLKLQTVPDELKALRKEKIYEIPTQLTIATAALESMLQAIEDQRFDHVVLGFRSGLIHCHFAIEQMLSLKILLESNESTNTHDLIELAKKAKITTFEEQREFLKDIGIHLWFCYPKDYPYFYPEKRIQPKTFLFLQKLVHPCESGKKLDVAMLKEAVQLFFTMYGKTIEFITEIASSPKENLAELLNKIKEIQNQIQIKKKTNKPFLENKMGIKCSQALVMLHEIDRLDNIKNFEKRLLLPLNTMKEYLELMKRSLEVPQEAHKHSLQEFIQVETLANIDKLFKDLFRTIILLQTDENNYTHNLSMLFQLAKGFYEKDLLTEVDEQLLKEINISITHHYLHKKSYTSLKKNYKYVFDWAEKLNLLSERDCIRISKRRSISYEILRRKQGEIFRKLDSAFDLFIKLLKPVIKEIKQLNEFL